MNFENSAQLFFTSDSESCHCDNWAMKNKKDSNLQKIDKMYNENINPHSKCHRSHSLIQDDSLIGSCYERNQILKEIGQVREDIVRFKSEMNGLAKKMNGMEMYLNHSKDRVYEIEKGLTATQEVNVNLLVLLEKAVHKQKESDVYATRAMKHIHTNLATVVYETGKLKGRLTTIAKYQERHQGNVDDVVERMKEYTYMLEQAHGTIQDLNRKSHKDTNKTLHHHHHHHHATAINKSELYRHRIIRKRTSELNFGLPQKGLRILLNDYQGY